MATRTSTQIVVRPKPDPPPQLRDTTPGKAVVLAAKGARGAGRFWWCHRAGLAPSSIGAGTALAGSALSAAPTSVAVSGWLFGAAATGGALCWHHVVRNRQQRPLTGAETAVYAGAGATNLGVLAAITADGPIHPVPAIAAGSVTAIAQIAWWIARHGNTPSSAQEPAEPDTPELTKPEIWAARIRPLAFPDTALESVQPVHDTDGNPNGFSGRIVLNISGPIKHTPDSITPEVVKKIALAYRAKASNIVIEPSCTDRVPITIFDRNPLQATVAWTGPVKPGSFRHHLGTSITNKPVFHNIWIPNYGGLHGMAVGSTGSGKSEAMLTLLNMEHATRDTDGRPLVATWLLDPQHGASFPGWRQHADVFAGRPGDIADALEGAVEELNRRVREMADRGDKLWIPTPDGPLISITVDELLILLKQIPRQLARRIIEALTVIANGGRKAAVVIRIGTQYPALDDIGDDMSIRDALMGYVLLLRTSNRQSGAMVAAGRPVGDAALLPASFADGSPTPGVMYYLGKEADAGVMMRAAVADPMWMTRGAPCRTGLDPIAAVQARREELAAARTRGEDEAIIRARSEDEAFDLQERFAVSQITAAATRAADPADLDTWPATALLLAQCDRPMRTGEIAEILGRPVHVVSQACGRARDRGLVEGDGHRGWVLPQYADALGAGR